MPPTTTFSVRSRASWKPWGSVRRARAPYEVAVPMSARFLFVALLFMAALVPTGSAFAAEPAPDSEIVYEKYDIKLSLPKDAVKLQARPAKDEVFREVYLADGLAYFARITETPPNYLASTAIEQAIQTNVKSLADTAGVKRWELYARSGDLFKGYSASVKPQECVLGAISQISELAEEGRVFQSVSMGPLGDESSPILTIGVIGAPGRAGETENQAKFVAFSVAKPDKLTPAVEQPSAQPPSKKPAPTRAPHTLKKGDIELTGSIATVAADKKSLVMTVTVIRMPGEQPIALDPSRTKRVFVNHLPEAVREGVPILVIGRNDGVGMPILADILQFRDESSPDKP